MGRGIYRRTEENKKNLSLALKGRILSSDHRENIKKGMKNSLNQSKTKFKKGHPSPNKGRKFGPNIEHSKRMTGRKASLETRNLMSEAAKGRVFSLKTRKLLSEANKGENNANWRGGLTKLDNLVRHSFEYRLWREKVFKRDGWTCRECEKLGGTLNVHHVKSFSQYHELRLNVDNGLTMCFPCHRKTDNYGGKKA